MAFMKFYEGSEANAQSYLDGIYLATDTHKLFYKGSPYGGDSYTELDWIQDFKSGSGTMEEAAFNKLKDAVDNYKLLVVSCSGAAHSTRVCTPEIGDDGSYICKFTDVNNYDNVDTYVLAVKIASVNPSTRAITMLHDTTYPLGGKDIDLSNYYTIAQVDGKIGTNVYTGANYISKETNLTEAVLQLDEEIKATNDNLALEHTNAEATYAKKTELGNYLTSVSIETISDLNSGWDALLKAAPNIPSLDGYATQDWVNSQNFIKKQGDSKELPIYNYPRISFYKRISDPPYFIIDLDRDNISEGEIITNSGYIELGTSYQYVLRIGNLGVSYTNQTTKVVTTVLWPEILKPVEALTTEEINNILNS